MLFNHAKLQHTRCIFAGICFTRCNFTHSYRPQLFQTNKRTYRIHERRQRRAGEGAVAPPWIFIHGTDIVDRGLIVLFFSLFSVGSPGRGLKCYFSVFFCYFLIFFSVGPPETGSIFRCFFFYFRSFFPLASPWKFFLSSPLIPDTDIIFCNKHG